MLRLDLDLRDSVGRRLHPDAMVVQQDRNLVMGAQPVIDLEEENVLDAAYLAIAAHRPLQLGRYMLLRPRGERTYWLYQAVIHDLAERPSCRPGNVRRAMAAVLDDALKRGLTVIATEALGIWEESGLKLQELVEALDEAISQLSVELRDPVRLVLLLGSMDDVEEASHHLRSRVLQRSSRSFRTVSGDAAVVEVRRDGVRLHYRFVPGSLSGYLVTRTDDVA